ncbi:hypothetical protein LNTAR_16608 [Lentisphaera araneosa HTCC2155]|uniref:Uncharacterized protein n=1 Tax=Lentisphaera araneosa HTCC2155 TaxID=313628 RepID=A6DQD6_9BACT|nr:right-handed parallel beta-helix repeat-containing protein [Lentisphaera araneosa]EDM26187.1 hypothetical protein LNTAR_16608 [Lentisphaera araneosa HTCC2155]
MYKKLLTLILIFSSMNLFASNIKVINVADFGVYPGEDASPGVYKALEACRQYERAKLVFPKGDYDFYPEYAREKYCSISNNDNGMKRMAFPLLNFKNLEVDGGGSEFFFHGRIVPFVIEGSENILVHNFSVDWKRTFHSEMLVQGGSVKGQYWDVTIDKKKYPYEIENEELVFYGRGWKEEIGQNIVWDPNTSAPIYNTKKYGFAYGGRRGGVIKCRKLANGHLRLSTKIKAVPPKGSVFVCKGLHTTNRLTPGFRVFDNSDITLKDITVYHAGSMGLIAERTKNITLDKFNVHTREGSGRTVSTTADATHFVNCGGLLTIKNSTFKHMLDDATNIHGNYLLVTKVIDDYTLGFSTSHFQHEGFVFARTGDHLRFVSQDELLESGTAVVESVKVYNSTYREVKFTSKVKHLANTDTAANNITWMPELHIDNCVVEENRARSILITTFKKALVENCRFSSMMAGILVEGDTHVWHEAGQVENLTIRNNEFGDMCYGGKGAVFQVSPKIPKDKRKRGFYHRNIVFENNTINTFDNIMVEALSVDGLIFRNNIIKRSGTFEPLNKEQKAFNFEKCKNILLEGNILYGRKIQQSDVSLSAECEKVNIR